MAKNKYALVDDDDYERLSKFYWKVGTIKKGAYKYAVRHIYKNKTSQVIFMHRDVLGMASLKLSDDKLQVDHINHNGFDNRKSNLRKCTNSQNMANTKIRSNNKSGYKGVKNNSHNPNKWEVALRFNKTNFYIGLFDDKIEAAIAYNKKAKELWGEFAYQNTIPKKYVAAIQ